MTEESKSNAFKRDTRKSFKKSGGTLKMHNAKSIMKQVNKNTHSARTMRAKSKSSTMKRSKSKSKAKVNPSNERSKDESTAPIEPPMDLKLLKTVAQMTKKRKAGSKKFKKLKRSGSDFHPKGKPTGSTSRPEPQKPNLHTVSDL